MSLFVQDLLLSTYDLGHIISQIRTFFSHDVFLQEMNMKWCMLCDLDLIKAIGIGIQWFL